MTDTPEPSQLETVARKAAEAALDALPDYAARLDVLDQAAAAQERRLDALARRVAELEAAPAPVPAADHGPAVAALARRVAELEAAPPADYGPAITGLENDIADLKLANLERTAR